MNNENHILHKVLQDFPILNNCECHLISIHANEVPWDLLDKRDDPVKTLTDIDAAKVPPQYCYWVSQCNLLPAAVSLS